MFRRSCGRIREVGGIGEFFREKVGNLHEGAEFRNRHRFENHFITMFFDENFISIETESSRQTDRLAASMSENLRSGHGYVLYLHRDVVKVRD